MPRPLARAGVTITGPSTGRLSMPVSFISFHGLRRGWPTLTESSFMTRRYAPPAAPAKAFPGAGPELHLACELVSAFGVVGADHPGQAHRGPFGIEIFRQAVAEEFGQSGPEQRRAQVVQLRQAERIRGIKELPVRRELERLGQQCLGACAQVVRGQPGVDVYVREHLCQV